MNLLEAQFELPRGLVVSCNNDAHEVGGLFYVDFRQGLVRKVGHGNYRGMIKHQDGYLAALQTGLVKHNAAFEVVAYAPVGDLDLHGVARWTDHYCLVTETNRNAVGIYEIATLDRVGEIRLNPADVDQFHMNDIAVDGDSLLLSMFSPTPGWRTAVAENQGVIAAIDLREINPTGDNRLDGGLHVVKHNLYMPHSIAVIDGQPAYCDSMNFRAMLGQNTIFRGQGFTRGLAKFYSTLFVGQSVLRHLDRASRGAQQEIALDGGLFVLNQRTASRRFIPLPVSQVYHILVDDTLAPSDAIDFSRPTRQIALPHPLEWHAAEPYRWMAATSAEFILQSRYPGQHVCCLDVTSGYPGPYSFEIVVNGRAFPVKRLEPGRFSVELPVNLPDKTARVTINVPFLWSPADVSGSADDRRLGIGLSRAVLMPKPQVTFSRSDGAD